jgi:hypothetical protein
LGAVIVAALERSSIAPWPTIQGTWQIGPGRDDSVGIAVHLLGLLLLCFVLLLIVGSSWQLTLATLVLVLVLAIRFMRQQS